MLELAAIGRKSFVLEKAMQQIAPTDIHTFPFLFRLFIYAQKSFITK